MNEIADTVDRLSLDELALQYGTDKSSRVHGYTRAYEIHFANLRGEPISLLEIGVAAGCSLRMWRDYFPRARIYGLDVRDCPALEGFDVVLFRGSQSDPSVLRHVARETGGCDLIIDDGSHLWSDQLVAFQFLYAHLRPGGWYVIEDLHTSYWNAYKAGENRPMEFFFELLHEMNLRGESGYGMLENDPNHAALMGDLTLFQRTVESVTFYKSIVLVKKKKG
jgi:hypothetical protein